MSNSTQTWLNSALKLDFNDENGIWLTSTFTLRKLIGILGMALPFLLYFSLLLSNGIVRPLVTFSDYYFTRVSTVLTIVLSLIGIFLLVYKGKKSIDFYISFLAGICAFLAIVFPTSNISNVCCDSEKAYSVTVLKDSAFRAEFHYITAGIFLLCLSYMSLFLFTKSDKSVAERGKRKILRNRVYRTCGILMIIGLLVIFAGYLDIIQPEYYDSHHITFWMETLIVESFGFSWLVKGRTLFND